MTDPGDLCTVDDVKALMQKTGPNAGNQDALIQTLITRASIKIMRDTGREFVPGGPNSEPFSQATRTFEFLDSDYGDETFVDLNPYDLAATQSGPLVVEIDTDTTSPTTLTTDQWRLWPRPASQGVFMAIKLLSMLGNIAPVGFRNRQLQVTGDWGFPSIPFEVTQACAETVIWWLTAYPAARAAAGQDASQAVVSPRSLPMSAVDLLSVFARTAIG